MFEVISYWRDTEEVEATFATYQEAEDYLNSFEWEETCEEGYSIWQVE